MINSEYISGTHAMKNSASDALLWLNRALMFTARALRRSVTFPQEELVTSFQIEYDVVLRQHHNMLVRPIFTMAMNAVPYRQDFYLKLDPHQDERKTMCEMEPWLAALERLVIIISSLLDNSPK
jgi:hypothetical protein